MRTELADIKEQLAPLRMQHEQEKSRVDEIRRVQGKLQEINRKIEVAERNRDTAKVADLRYFAIPDLEKRLAMLTVQRAEEQESKGSEALMKEVVNDNEIADVVSRWTGVPVSKLTTSARERLLASPEAAKIFPADAIARAVDRRRVARGRRARRRRAAQAERALSRCCARARCWARARCCARACCLCLLPECLLDT